MKFGTKVKMVRNGLGMNTSEFAKICKISRAGLNKIERLETNPQSNTVDMIEKAVNARGWVFVENGVLQEDKLIITYDSSLQVLDNALHTLKSGEEILFYRADDRRSRPEILAKLDEMKEKGIKMKSIISEENNFIIGDPADYRQIDPEYFDDIHGVEVIYGNKWMTKERKKKKDGTEMVKYFVLTSEHLAEKKRKDFFYWWRKGKCLAG